MDQAQTPIIGSDRPCERALCASRPPPLLSHPCLPPLQIPCARLTAVEAIDKLLTSELHGTMLPPSLPPLTRLAFRQCATGPQLVELWPPGSNSLRYYKRSLNIITTPPPTPPGGRGVMRREATLSAVVDFASERRIKWA